METEALDGLCAVALAPGNTAAPADAITYSIENLEKESLEW
jgi:hypothetical protein